MTAQPMCHHLLIKWTLVPAVHGEGRQHVGCSNFSILGGRDTLLHLTGATVIKSP